MSIFRRKVSRHQIRIHADNVRNKDWIILLEAGTIVGPTPEKLRVARSTQERKVVKKRDIFAARDLLPRPGRLRSAHPCRVLLSAALQIRSRPQARAAAGRGDRDIDRARAAGRHQRAAAVVRAGRAAAGPAGDPDAVEGIRIPGGRDAGCARLDRLLIDRAIAFWLFPSPRRGVGGDLRLERGEPGEGLSELQLIGDSGTDGRAGFLGRDPPPRRRHASIRVHIRP